MKRIHAALVSLLLGVAAVAGVVEVRARGGEGLVPWDGETMGELEVRGPSVASAYHDADDAGRWRSVADRPRFARCGGKLF